MSVLQVLQVIACVGTIVTGFISLLFPLRVTGFTGLQPLGGRGITEIRAVLGALFIGLGAAPLILREKAAYRAAGIGYLAVALVRAASMLIDKSVVRSNVVSLLFEIVFGVILVL